MADRARRALRSSASALPFGHDRVVDEAMTATDRSGEATASAGIAALQRGDGREARRLAALLVKDLRARDDDDRAASSFYQIAIGQARAIDQVYRSIGLYGANV